MINAHRGEGTDEWLLQTTWNRSTPKLNIKQRLNKIGLVKYGCLTQGSPPRLNRATPPGSPSPSTKRLATIGVDKWPLGR